MSATMSGRSSSARFQTFALQRSGVIRGVCAHIADRAGVPVWMPRAAFLMFGVLHWLLALIAYVILSRMFRQATPAFSAAPNGPPPSAVQDRFSALDARLAAMETTTLQQETTLRRAFRDLERS